MRRPLRQRWVALLLAMALVLIVLTIILRVLQTRLLGDGPTLQGGSLGRRVDNTVKRWLFYWRDWQYRRDFHRDLGFAVPPCPERAANAQGVPVLLSTFATETLRRARARHALQQAAPQLCPNCLFWPLVGEWWHPDHNSRMDKDKKAANNNNNNNITRIPYLEAEMDLWMLDHLPSLYEVYQSLALTDRVQVWGLAVLAEYGGSFQGPDDQMSHDEEIDPDDASPFSWTTVPRNGRLTIAYAQASMPQAPALQCAFRRLTELWDEPPQDDSDDQYYALSLEPILLFSGRFAAQCPSSVTTTNTNDCCQKLAWPSPPPSEEDEDETHSSNGKEEESLPNAEADSEAPETRPVSPIRPQTQVEIVALDNNGADGTVKKTTTKVSHAQQLQDKGCTPGWWCNRCLKLPWWGTLQKCAALCHACYVQHMTQRHDALLKRVEIQVRVTTPAKQQQPPASRIPRIVHQTWFEDLTTATYPHLHRLQQSWQAAGWDYRFYTDATARAYIAQHYPAQFVEAYDALVPGAFKADLFRLLVLLKDGGVYADVDVQLETSLDALLASSPGISLIVPRDVPLDRWPDSNYCLWNGLMGAAPGHPLLAQAAQDLVNRIANRWDYYDVENNVCSSGSNGARCEIWKLRSIPVLLLTGPCALGLSINAHLENDKQRRLWTHGFDLGWTPVGSSDDDDGIYILLTDRYDMGELRFTDVDRALLVASTNANKLVTFRWPDPDKALTQKQHAHYSKSETDIMGSSGTYVDDQVTNELIQLTIHHQPAAEEEE